MLDFPIARLTRLLTELAQEQPPAERYRQLMRLLTTALPCDAVALLRYEGGERMRPVAMAGLSVDVMGRHFLLGEHPRLDAIWAAGVLTRFPADCDLPDPYDGLLLSEDALRVHDCLGAPLRVNGRPWGMLTLDALKAGSFNDAQMATLRLLVALAEAVVAAVEAVGRLRQERNSARALQQTRQEPVLVGTSEALATLRQDIAAVADSDLTVLISGETGTGKELVAQAVHRQSLRRESPLVTVNAAALPENLVESELFGHQKGAFTGATEARRGKFQLADGGTLFLDEVGELPLAVQAKLLRVLQSGELQPLGGEQPGRVNVRVIAATNRTLAEEVRAGRFRADLYHRLSVYPVTVPPLRERGRDVLLLTGHFAEINRVRLGLRALRLNQRCLPVLLDYDWPGNVRELEHVVSRAAVLARHRHPGVEVTVITPELLDLPAPRSDATGVLPPAPASPGPSPPVPAASMPESRPLRAAVDDYQRRLIRQALTEQGSWAGAARVLRMDPANLQRLARRLNPRD